MANTYPSEKPGNSTGLFQYLLNESPETKAAKRASKKAKTPKKR